LASARVDFHHSDSTNTKPTTVFFECFPYVCPEPVLVKSSFLYINYKWRKKTGQAARQPGSQPASQPASQPGTGG
jgi:hypothetical protein